MLQFQKAAVTPGDVHVNTPLTNISLGIFQTAEGFVADKVFPNVPVAKQSDIFYTFDRGYFNRDEMDKRAPATESKGGSYSIDTDLYYAPVYAFHHDIDDQRRANSDSALEPDREATALVTMKGLIRREKMWANAYFRTGIWENERTGVTSGETPGTSVRQWNDADSNPIGDVREARTVIAETTGLRPNTLIIGSRVLNALLDHPDIVDRVKYGTGNRTVADIDVAELQALFKIPRIFVMEGVENTAKEGQDNVHTFIGGKHALLAYAAPSPGMQTPTAGYTFSWTGYLGAAPNGLRIKRFRLENIASDRVEAEMAVVQKLVSADLGFFFLNIVA